MPNHPNRSKSAPPTDASTPKPDEVRELRRANELTAEQCGAIVHVSGRAWQRWEAGDRPMHPAFFELARMKIAAGIIPLPKRERPA